MVSPDSAAKLQRPVGQFNTQAEADAACEVLRSIGLSTDRISILTQNLDPNPSMQQSQVGRSAVGGAIAGATYGAIVAVFLTLSAQYLPSATDITPASSPFLVGGICVLVGTAAGSLLAALAGNNIPHMNSHTDRESLTQTYIVMLDGTTDEAYRAKEALGQPKIQV